MAEPVRYILRGASPDAIGIQAAVSGYIATRKLNVVESHDYADPVSKRFFFRLVVETSGQLINTSDFEKGFEDIDAEFGMTWSLRRADEAPNALVMASKADHCLNDLLYRHRRGRLGVNIVAIVSNHTDAKWHADRHDLPFHHVAVTPETKPESEHHLREIITETKTDLVVLARYMQILSNDLSRELEGRCINIHHSFLPSFKGAKPYHQAHARGVKLIGATAHYVTADLDEGPIIYQSVQPVDHRATPGDMVALGRDTEALTLARAVRAHGEGRVFMNGHRTVVFD